MNPLVSTAWLADRRKEPDLRIVDAAWYMPGDPRTGRAEYDKEHIPGAVYFDIDAISDTSTSLPHMLSSPEAFSEAVGGMGINTGDRIVVYDHLGVFSAARVWWNFRVMGHREVFVLDGGLARWKAEGRPVTADATVAARQTFEARYDAALVRDLSQVKDALASGVQVIDARAADRFSGTVPEPRAGLPSGHMPGAMNLPWSTLVENAALLPANSLRQAFEACGVDLGRPIVTTCGSGVSAASLALALAVLGREDVAVYDGSWTEWASTPGTAISRD